MAPLIVDEIRVGSDDVIRVTLEGALRKKACLRQWFRPSTGGAMRPGKAGLSVPLHKLDDLVAALVKAGGTA